MSLTAKTFLAWLLVLVLLPTAHAADPPGLGIGNQMTNMFDTMLNHTAPTPQGFGYAVFGRVTNGMDVVDKIAAVETGNRGGHQDVPVDAVTITEVTIDD